MIHQIQEYAVEFLQRYSDQRFSQRTVELYGMILNRFLSFYREHEITSIDRNYARMFLAKIGETNGAISTNLYLSVLRVYFKWLKLHKSYQGISGFEEIANRKEPDLLPVFLIEHERELLYRLVDDDPKIKVKDVIMLDVFIGTGIRTSELCYLKATDFFIYQTDGYFKLRVTKGGNEREVIMPAYTKEQVIKLIYMNSLNGYKDEWVFPNLRGKQLTRQGVYNRIQRMVSKVKSRKMGAHTLRHTFATWAMDRDVPLKAIQLQLGHKSANSTARYTHTSKERVKKVHARSHPKEKP